MIWEFLSFLAYKNKWIPDTPTWRKNSLKLFKMWVIASNSSPLEGIEWALIKYSDPKKVCSNLCHG